ncbi:hypothetical protein Tco_0441143 [Tanacetum coccineum]
MVQLQIIPNQCRSEQALNISDGDSLKDTWYIVLSYRGRLRVVAKKKDISENRASRNFDLMIIKGQMKLFTSVKARLHQMTLIITFRTRNSRHSNGTVKFIAGSKVVHLGKQDSTSRQELELLFIFT